MSVLTSALILFGITCLPLLELRASIPFGFFNREVAGALPWPVVVGVCIAANILVGWATYWVMGPVVAFCRRWDWFERRLWPRLERSQHKLKPYVDKYGEWGVAIFIGVPLPGTGAYTGAFGSYLLGLDRRKFAVANIVGVLLAGLAVTALCLLIQNGVVAEGSWVRRLFIKEIG
jgi:uncharacterized membrane protein